MKSEDVGRALRKKVNADGHGFHYAVMRELDALQFTAAIPEWAFLGAEFPVEADTTTHIDFVYNRGSVFVVGECKRSDPAKSNWCFLRAPYTWMNEPEDGELVFDHVVYDDTARTLDVGTTTIVGSKSYGIGVPIRSTGEGSGGGQPSKGISSAIDQVLRGASGFHNYWVSNTEYANRDSAATFLPVIFTTATLWVSDEDISKADLFTGELDADALKPWQTDWLWFNYNRSRAIGPVQETRTATVRHGFSRSVAIVTPNGIQQFFRAAWAAELGA